MITHLADLNWLSIGVAFVAFFMLGYVWYEVLFKKQYKISLGKEDVALPQKPIYIVGPAICGLFYIIASAILMDALNINSYVGATEFSFIIGIGYLVANTVNIAINPNIPKPIYYGIISGSYFQIAILISNLILVAMK